MTSRYERQPLLPSGGSGPSGAHTHHAAMGAGAHKHNGTHQKSEWSASVQHKGHSCTMTYSAARERVTMTRVSSQGKLKTLLNIPVSHVLNIETPEERDARQRMRQANDDTTKLGVNHDGGRSAFCTFPLPEDDDTVFYAHTRMDTMNTLPGGASATSISYTSQQHMTTHDASEAAARYFIHYVRPRKTSGKSIHTVELYASTAQQRSAAQDLATAVLSRIYPKGGRHLVAFVSPCSGQGQGERIFEKGIKPILHFSRHTVRMYVTRHAHDCENFIADLANPLDASYVCVAVGGDGMMHEVVNGLHRRRLALIDIMRAECASASSGAKEEPAISIADNGTNGVSSSSAATSQRELPPVMPVGSQGKRFANLSALFASGGWDAIMPLAATIPAGSACGLAKTLDVLETAQAAMALVHLHSCSMDLMNMQFAPNPDLVNFHAEQMPRHKRISAEKKFNEYSRKHKTELQQRVVEAQRTQLYCSGGESSEEMVSTEPTSDERKSSEAAQSSSRVTPFFKDGGKVFTDPISYKVGAPAFENRVAFMSLSFGIANDIDHGSEHLRWMGNARFALYGGYVMLQGLRKYPCVLRYLPWESHQGLKVEKIHPRDKMPHPSQLAPCTLQDDCSHCRQYAPSDDIRQTMASASKGAALPLTDSEMLQEESVDFDDPDLPWVTIRGDFFTLLICSLRDVAQDMVMAPLSHVSDGGMDLVFSRVDPETGKGGRKEFFQLFTSLETGEHVDFWFTNYVRARAVEVKVDGGISMSDGEMMPLSSVRLTKLRKAVRMVRSPPQSK